MATHRTPHGILGLATGATPEQIRAARRRLARQHHPDRFAGDAAGARAATREMALINAAAEALLGEAWATQPPAGARPHGGRRAERPVSARVAVASAPPTNARTSQKTEVRWRAAGPAAAPRRSASWAPLPGTPAGPVERRRDPGHDERLRPSPEAARAHVVPFGRYAGGTVGQVARRDPGYLAWCVDNVRRDPHLVAAADVVLEELERSGTFRRPPRGSLFRPSPNAFAGGGGDEGGAA
ncbi:MAG: DnaJ domain [Chloroflexota bacterium]